MNRLRQLETFARVGWFARGVVYSLLGYLALSTAGTSATGPQDVFRRLIDLPGGTILLFAVAAGLAVYGAYRLYTAVFDSERKGGDAKGLAMRAAYAASALAHFLFTWGAVKLALGLEMARDAEQEQAFAATVLDLPLGGLWLGLIGLAFVAAAIHQAKKAWSAKFLRDFAHTAPTWVKPLGMAGFAARAIVFAVIGYSLMRAGWFEQAEQVNGLGGAIAFLGSDSTLQTVVAAGLFLFGLYSFAEATWRRVGNEDVVNRMKSASG